MPKANTDAFEREVLGDGDDGSWNKAMRLAVAGAVAPHLREQHERASRRRVARVDAAGNVVAYTTLAEVQKALLEQRRIELEVVEGIKAKEFFCERCGHPTRVARRQRRKRCDRCTFLKCSGCDKDLPNNYSAPSMRRGDGDAICLACRKARTAANRAKCTQCGATMNYNSVWQYRKRWGADEPLRCGPCSREHRKLPPPACSGCGKELARTALASPRAKSGKPPMCRDCYRGEARAAIAREKHAADPTYAAKVRAALAKGWERSERIRKPRASCASCSKVLGASASRPSSTTKMCRSCSHRYRWAKSGRRPRAARRK